MAVVATFIPVPPPGEFQFYNDIPARDLTDEDWANLTPDQQTLVEGSSLYHMEA